MARNLPVSTIQHSTLPPPKSSIEREQDLTSLGIMTIIIAHRPATHQHHKIMLTIFNINNIVS
jgi:hypothetical protein